MTLMLIALLVPAFAGSPSASTVDWRDPDWERIVADAGAACQADMRSKHDMVAVIKKEQALGNAAAHELIEMARTTLPDAERELRIMFAEDLSDADAHRLSAAFQSTRNAYASMAAHIGGRTLRLEEDKARYASTRQVRGRSRNRLVGECMEHVVNGIRFGTVAVQIHERLMAILLNETSSVVRPIIARKENPQALPSHLPGVTRSHNPLRAGPNP